MGWASDVATYLGEMLRGRNLKLQNFMARVSIEWQERNEDILGSELRTMQTTGLSGRLIRPGEALRPVDAPTLQTS